MKIHVTGKKGLLGAEVMRVLAPQGEVHGTDIDEMDITRPEDILRVLGESPPDVLVHVAALKGNRPSCERPMEFFDVNTVGTLHLLEACRALHIPRFVFVSSMTVHGPQAQPITEEAPFAPIHPYAGSKVAAEMMIQAYAKAYGIHATILRPNFIVGPIEAPHPYVDNIIYDFLNAARSTGTIELAGDGSFEREWLHPRDVASAVALAAQSTRPGCDVFLLSGNRVTMRGLAERVIQRMGTGHVTTNPSRSGFSLISSNARACEVLGWEPQVSLDALVGEICDEYAFRQQLQIHEIKQISIEMAGGCNLKCPMCPQSDGREKEFLARLPLEEFRKIIDEAVPLGLKFVILSGSGEPLLHTGLEDAVAYLTARDVETMIYTNGTLMTPERFERLCQAGLTICKVSCQGWDRDSYARWMSADKYDQVREQLKACVEILKEKGYPTLLQTNHLIHDVHNMAYETEMYLNNWVRYLDVKSEIWMAHNWAGQYGNDGIKRHETFRDAPRRSCGRPLGPIVEIRAGGLGGKKGAVVPCPYVLGMDSKAVMGHTEDTPLMDVVNGEKMQALRAAHLKGDFDAIDICRNCDQLLDVQESLVWTNIDGRSYGTSRISLFNYMDYVPAEQKAALEAVP